MMHNPEVNKKDIPAELVTASGSGLDPDLSPEAALIQVKRIARLRKIQPSVLVQFIHQHTVKPLLGPEKINVLQLNIDLNKFETQLKTEQ
jgi:K+-transporting ATPase ATPase C chain